MLEPPCDLRDSFNLLTRLGPHADLDLLLAGVDWQGATPQQLCYAALGRLPQDLFYSGQTGVRFEPAAYFRSLLLSHEFQDKFISNLLGDFPEKPRRFFVHIPRCGGTSLGETLAAHACTIPYNSVGADWCSGHAFLEIAGDICRGIPLHDAIHISGHYTLRSIVDGRLARFGDSIWTSVRAPQEIVLSYANYILTVLESDPERERPDTREWSRRLALECRPSALPPDRLQSMLKRMLHDDGLIPRDLLCHFLGDGTAHSALDLLASADVEVIDSGRLDRWREQRWNIPAPPWANVSRRYFDWKALREAEQEEILSLVKHDQQLYGTIASSLGASVSVGGLTIARSASVALPPPTPAVAVPGRIRRAARPILRDPKFVRVPASLAFGSGSRLGWTEPPLNYRTLETTLIFPLGETRIRVRYARRPRLHHPRRPWHSAARRLGQGLYRWFGYLGTKIAR